MTDDRPAETAREGEPPRPMPRAGEAVQFLRQSLERVERERQGLMRVASSLDDFVRSQEARFSELEQELNDTALLYVASYQLQARDEPRAVLRQLYELLEQLIGVESFVMYLGTAEGSLTAVASRGVSERELASQRTNEAALADAFAKRAPVIVQQAPLPTGTLERPLALIPLLLGARVVGAISIVKLFAHKPSWASVDAQLLQLLATHAASALLAAHFVRQAEQRNDLLGTLRSLGEGLR
jgi:K+-sensing histidine kinase KdpD